MLVGGNLPPQSAEMPAPHPSPQYPAIGPKVKKKGDDLKTNKRKLAS